MDEGGESGAFEPAEVGAEEGLGSSDVVPFPIVKKNGYFSTFPQKRQKDIADEATGHGKTRANIFAEDLDSHEVDGAGFSAKGLATQTDNEALGRDAQSTLSHRHGRGEESEGGLRRLQVVVIVSVEQSPKVRFSNHVTVPDYCVTMTKGRLGISDAASCTEDDLFVFDDKVRGQDSRE